MTMKLDRYSFANRRDPFAEVTKLFEEFNVANNSGYPTFRLDGPVYRAEIVATGADKKDISVTATEKGVLVVKYKASTPNRFCADFAYEWALRDVDLTAIKASCENGVLYLSVPRTQKTSTTVTIPVN